MVEEGIRAMLDLGSLDCLSPSAPFGTFDANTWAGFGEWLIKAEVLSLAAGSSDAVMRSSELPKGSSSTPLTALCSEGGGVWTNRFRMAPLAHRQEGGPGVST